MKIAYRPEIDGLRAIAIIAVILYHSQITIFDSQLFKGGFIGVDIFFVISGYLITSIILKELIITETFSFKYFYERRVRRILPVLLFVILSSLPFAWIYLFPSGFVDYSKTIIYSLGLISNFYFHYSGQVYGAMDGLFKPFLHTWSLSVEEQYYVLIPALLLIIFKYFRKYLIQILLFGFFISLSLAEWSSRNYPSISFYFIHTRMWEILAGSILAYIEITKSYKSKHQVFNLILPIVGLLLIGLSIFFFNDSMLHPSLYTLPPIIGVCLIIWFSRKDALVTKILSTKLFVGIGLISYSLYLWHYPIFAFIKINGLVSGSIIGKFLLVPFLFILSFLSYYFIERPFRNREFKSKKITIFLSFLFFILLFINIIIIKNHGYQNRFDNLKIINKNYNPDNIFLGQTRMKKSQISLKDFNTEDFNIIIIGDSHGGDLFNALNLNSDLFKGISFFYLQDFSYEDLLKNEKYLKNADMIIISYRWDDEKFVLLKNNFQNIENLNKKIFISSGTNEYKVHSKLYTLLDHEVLFKKNDFNYFELKKFYFENRVIHTMSDINVELEKFALKKKIQYLNKEDYMCDIIKKECDYVDEDGYKIFYDYGHYTEHGAKYFGKIIYETNWLRIN